MNDYPRISFGIIVLNGYPFTKYCLRSIYPFAHQIIVVEGAVPGAASIATPEGHSTDGTLESLLEFKEREDPENKLEIVSKDGFWHEKDEMCRAYAERATGDYLWQVDIDEFYKSDDIRRVLAMLEQDPAISAVSFKQVQFWGGFDYYVDGWYVRMGNDRFHRLFKWGENYVYQMHRPPTVLNREGINVRKLKWLNSDEMERQGIFLYHYALVFPRQVMEKCSYYGKAQWAKRPGSPIWAQEAFTELRRPYRAHNVYEYPGWLEPFSGVHPEQIGALIQDLKTGVTSVVQRPTDDIDSLLHSRKYAFWKMVLKRTAFLARLIRLRILLYRTTSGLLTNPADTCRKIWRKMVNFRFE